MRALTFCLAVLGVGKRKRERERESDETNYSKFSLRETFFD